MNAKEFVDVIKKASEEKTKSYDTTAVVKRVEGDTLWVHIAGGADETPVRRTVDAKAGDTVQIRVANGDAWAQGNGTSPPTDDARANYAHYVAVKAEGIAKDAEGKAEEAAEAAAAVTATAAAAKEIAEAAEAIAEAIGQHFWYDTNGVHISENEDDPDGVRNALWNSTGMLFRKATNILLAILSGDTAATRGIAIYDGAGNAAGNVIASLMGSGIRLGRDAPNPRVVIDANGVSIYSKTLQDTFTLAVLGSNGMSFRRQISGTTVTGANISGDGFGTRIFNRVTVGVGEVLSYFVSSRIDDYGFIISHDRGSSPSSSSSRYIETAYIKDGELRVSAADTNGNRVGIRLDFITTDSDGDGLFITDSSGAELFSLSYNDNYSGGSDHPSLTESLGLRDDGYDADDDDLLNAIYNIGWDSDSDPVIQ